MEVNNMKLDKYINMEFSELCELSDKELKEIELKIIDIFNEYIEDDSLGVLFKEYIEPLDELYSRIDYIMNNR
jgi:hypothetical protein